MQTEKYKQCQITGTFIVTVLGPKERIQDILKYNRSAN